MTSVGEVLRAERMRRNLGLEQVSRELKISRKLLEAIEEDRFDKLPGGVFARAFVRQYATLLELDGEELASRVHETLGPDPLPAGVVEHGSVGGEIRMGRFDENIGLGSGRTSWSASLWSLALVVLVILLCSGVYTVWQYWRRPSPPAETATAVSKPAPAPTPTAPVTAPPPALPEATPAQPGAVDPGAAAQPAGNPPSSSATVTAPPGATGQASASVPPAGAEAAQPGAAAPASASAPPPKPAPAPDVVDPNAPVKVELVPLAPVWVRVQSDGKYKFSGTLEPDRIRSVSANEEVVLRVGNAADLEVRLNGKPIGPLGPRGQVRTIQLTSGGFKIVPPKPAAPPIEPF